MKVNLVSLLLLALSLRNVFAATCTGTISTDSSKGCFVCKAVDPSECESCDAGFGDVLPGGCTICSKGTYSPDGTTGSCSGCGGGKTTVGTGSTSSTDCFTLIDSCTTYSGKSVCSACSGGNIPILTGSLCATPIASCSVYASASVCTTCISGYTAINSGASCVTTIAGCAQQASGSVCTSCEAGKLLVNNGAQCVAPIQNCKTQSSDSVCSECATEHKLSIDKKSCMQNSSTSNTIIKIFFGLTLGVVFVLF